MVPPAPPEKFSAAEDAAVVIEDTNVRRTAGWGEVAYHSITAMVGAGVLGLPATFSHLGWAGGIIFLCFSFWVSWYTYKLLVYMHEVPDLDAKAGAGGVRRLDRYDQLADYVFGPKRGKAILLPFQLAVLIGIGITYVVVGGDSLHAFIAIVNPNVLVGKWVFYVTFGVLQLLLSLLPSFNELGMVSLLGALMSVCYCTIAVAMSGVSINSHGTGTVNYNPALVSRTPLEKAMGIFNAMTTILFAYGGHNIALEVQATLPVSPKEPSTVPRMMKGVNWTFCITGLAYFLVSIVGFAAFGTGVGDNLLLTFKHGPTSWVVAVADMMVILHVAAAFQVYTQPVYQLIETGITKRTGRPSVNPALRITLRLTYVVLLTVIGVIIPFFGNLMGLVGAVGLTPTTFLLPPLLWLLYKRPPRFGVEWWTNWGLVWITGIIGLLGTVGSLYGIIVASASYKIFAA